MIARRLPLILVVALVVLAGVAPALAQDARLQAAKKEGKVVWYTSLVLPSAEKIARLFEAQYGLRATVNAIVYNTRALSAAEAPKSWKDLLDPKWKGKLVTAHPGYSGIIATHVLALVHLHGWDYFKQLAQNKPMIVQSANDPATTVASGERVVAVNGGEYSAYQLRKKGNPIEIVYPKEGVSLVVSPTAIASFAPHPNAAKLFTDFTFTRACQQVMADSEGLYTGHPEVSYPADKPKLDQLKLLTVDGEELEKRNEELKKRFVEFFGA